jgi:hypothetical protein
MDHHVAAAQLLRKRREAKGNRQELQRRYLVVAPHNASKMTRTQARTRTLKQSPFLELRHDGRTRFDVGVFNLAVCHQHLKTQTSK